MKKCIFESCSNEVIAKNLCNKHYYKKYREIHPKITIKKTHSCKENNCKTRISLSKIYCCKHCPKKPDGRVGKLAWNWKGGISFYKNQRLMKKNRLIIMEKYNWICQECGKKATDAHHKDQDKSNHSINNLIPLCHYCHCQKHVGRMNKTKFTIKYGLSAPYIAKKLNTTTVNVTILEHINLLEKILKK